MKITDMLHRFQQLELKHVEDRGCFAAMEFRWITVEWRLNTTRQQRFWKKRIGRARSIFWEWNWPYGGAYMGMGLGSKGECIGSLDGFPAFMAFPLGMGCFSAIGVSNCGALAWRLLWIYRATQQYNTIQFQYHATVMWGVEKYLLKTGSRDIFPVDRLFAAISRS